MFLPPLKYDMAYNFLVEMLGLYMYVDGMDSYNMDANYGAWNASISVDHKPIMAIIQTESPIEDEIVNWRRKDKVKGSGKPRRIR